MLTVLFMLGRHLEVYMLQVNHIKLSYGPRLILDDVSFTVAPGEKAGLIGVNGAGKSSLLKIIAGLQEADGGTVVLPRTYGYLSQDVAHEAPVSEGSTVRDFIFTSTGLDTAIRTYEELSIKVAEATNGNLTTLLEHFEQAQDALERLGYYDADARSEQLISGLNIGGVTLDRTVSTLSGGQKTKLALVRLLFQAPELLLLDEPTNFLDVEATGWLMEFLESYKGALLIISHDLDLLDRSINKVLRQNEFTHKLEEYRGTYSNYLTITGDALALMERTKQQLPQNSRRIHIDFPVRQSSSLQVVRADHLSKRYGTKEIFHNINFEVERGQRLVIVGLNGAGKTTLLRTLLGITPPNGGKVTMGDRVRIGYYAQENEGLDYNNTVLNETTNILPGDTKRVRGVLGRFLFTGD